MSAPHTFVAPPPPLRTDEHGVIRIIGTRVTLRTVIGAFHGGCTAEQVVFKYPTLRLADVYAVIAYYLSNRAAIDEYIAEEERQAGELRHTIEARFPSAGIRDRLLARQVEQADK
jgi:uncharacterized protein (DUF433 family)